MYIYRWFQRDLTCTTSPLQSNVLFQLCKWNKSPHDVKNVKTILVQPLLALLIFISVKIATIAYSMSIIKHRHSQNHTLLISQSPEFNVSFSKIPVEWWTKMVQGNYTFKDWSRLVTDETVNGTTETKNYSLSVFHWVLWMTRIAPTKVTSRSEPFFPFPLFSFLMLNSFSMLLVA